MIKLLIKLLFTPFTILALVGTAAITYATDNNWKYWKEYNSTVINMIPFYSGDN